METCTHCTRVIPDTQAPYLWQGAVVCSQCHGALVKQSHLEISPRRAPAFRTLVAVIACLLGILAGCLLILAFHLTAADIIGRPGQRPAPAGAADRHTQSPGRAPVAPTHTAAFKRFILRLAATMRTHDRKSAADGTHSRVTVRILRWDVRTTRSLRYPVQWLLVLQETQTFTDMRVPCLYRIYLVDNNGRWKMVKAAGRPRQSMVNHQALAGQSYFSDCTDGMIADDVAIAAGESPFPGQKPASTMPAMTRP